MHGTCGTLRHSGLQAPEISELDEVEPVELPETAKDPEETPGLRKLDL